MHPQIDATLFFQHQALFEIKKSIPQHSDGLAAIRNNLGMHV